MELHRKQRNNDLPCNLKWDAPPQENAEDKLKKYLAAKKEYENAYIKENYGKQTPVKELKSNGKSILKAGGKLIDNFFDANGRIADSVERDIYNHSLQRKFNNLALDALYYKDKQAKLAKSKKNIKGSNSYIIVEDDHGNLHKIPKNRVKSRLTKTQRR